MMTGVFVAKDSDGEVVKEEIDEDADDMISV